MIIMKKIVLCCLLQLTIVSLFYGQNSAPTNQQQKAIASLIDQYSEARKNNDTVLLKTILTTDVDQLVSTGEWRKGIRSAVEGMLKSSGPTPGARIFRVESIRMINPTSAIVDCRYEIQNTGGSWQKMWSTFIVIAQKSSWRISAIRNMLPAGQ